MDALEQFLGGTQKQQPKTASVITDQLLDSLRRVESGKDPFALNKDTKAMGPYQFMPETVQMLHKQGMKFNAFDEQESREAARTYLGQLVDRNKGDVDKALAQYGGFVTKDPSGYVNKVKQGQTAPVQQPAQVATSDDPLEAFLSNKPVQQSRQQQQVDPQQRLTPQQMESFVAPASEAAPAEPKGILSVAKGGVMKFLNQNPIKEGLSTLADKTQIGPRAAGEFDTAFGVIPATYGAVVQGIARTANTPQAAEAIGKAAAGSIEKPIGRIFGVTGKEAYQKPLGGITEPIAKEINRLANVLGLTPEQISEKTGVPVEDVKQMAVTSSFVTPKVVGPVLTETAPAVKSAAATVAKPFQEMAKDLEVVRPLSKTEAQAQFEAKQAPSGNAGAAAVQQNPYLGKFVGEEVGKSETFPRIKLEKIPNDVPISEQKLRSQLFQEVLPGVKPRPGVVTGNDNLLRNEHALAGMAEPTPLGQLMKQQIANEQIGLAKFAEERVNATGASRSLVNDEQRGGIINDVFHGVDPEDLSQGSITGYLNQSKKAIYDDAFSKVGNNKIETTHLDNFVNDPLEISTFKAGGQTQLLDGAKELINLARTTGFKMKDGTVLPPGSVASYDHVRKIFNSPKIWNRDRASFIRDINGAIDQDIAAVADPALYKLGDKIHKLEKDLFKSKGIDKVFGEIDPNGVITSATPLEKLPSKLNNLPKDQWRHIRDTLSELAQGRIRNAPEGLPPVPEALRKSAAAAVSEIDGSLAREVYKAGAGNMGEWSSKKTNDILNSVVGQKIVETFPPSEVQKFHALNYVGHYTPPLKYEGAALQARRVGLLEKGLPSIGATVGGSVASVLSDTNPLAIGGGAYVGRDIGTRMQTRKAVKEEIKAVKKMQQEMEKAAKLGKQSGQNKLNDLNK